jgi:hypothetical protein
MRYIKTITAHELIEADVAAGRRNKILVSIWIGQNAQGLAAAMMDHRIGIQG